MVRFLLLPLHNKYHSTRIVRAAITAIPAISDDICLRDSHEFFSLNNSGSTVTNAMCKKPPAVKGKIHDVFASVKIYKKTKQKTVNLMAVIINGS